MSGPTSHALVLRRLGADVLALCAIASWVIPGGGLVAWLPTGDARSLTGEWLPALLVLLVVRVVEGRPVASVGLCRISRRDIRDAVLLLLGLLLIGGITMNLSFGQQSAGQHMAALGQRHSIPFLVLLSLSAGFCEELMFRGYLIERISERTGSALVGAFVSWGLFVAGHIWAWGLASFVTVAPWTALITYAYLQRRRLAITILAHAANDVVAFVIMPLAMRWLGAPAG